MFQLTPI